MKQLVISQDNNHNSSSWHLSCLIYTTQISYIQFLKQRSLARFLPKQRSLAQLNSLHKDSCIPHRTFEALLNQ